MEKFKEIIKRIKELANSFINPIPPEPTFKELALASDVSEAELAELEKTMKGVKWDFSEEYAEPKKGKAGRATSKETQLESIPKNIIHERNIGEEREDR